MEEQERKDLDEMLKKVQEEKLSTYEFLKYLSRATKAELVPMGYGNVSNAEAMKKAFDSSVAKIERLSREHVRKYPD